MFGKYQKTKVLLVREICCVPAKYFSLEQSEKFRNYITPCFRLMLLPSSCLCIIAYRIRVVPRHYASRVLHCVMEYYFAQSRARIVPYAASRIDHSHASHRAALRLARIREVLRSSPPTLPHTYSLDCNRDADNSPSTLPSIRKCPKSKVM